MVRATLPVFLRSLIPVTIHPFGAPEPPEKPPAQVTTQRRRSVLPSGFATIRDLVSFIAGLAIIGHEVFLSPQTEAYALALGLTLCGLPVAFSSDEKKGRRK